MRCVKYTTALVYKMIAIICSAHCDCMLLVRKKFCAFYRSAGVKRLKTTALMRRTFLEFAIRTGYHDLDPWKTFCCPWIFSNAAYLKILEQLWNRSILNYITLNIQQPRLKNVIFMAWIVEHEVILHQGSPNYGPRAKSVQRSHFIRPPKVFCPSSCFANWYFANN